MCDKDIKLAASFHRLMLNVQKACPIVTRTTDQGLEVLAFSHPLAGFQFVKGTIEKGEAPSDAAKRELFEESGLVCPEPLELLGSAPIGPDQTTWHFYVWHSTGLLDTWSHATTDDQGHNFAFFWHPIDLKLAASWHPIFHEAFNFFSGCIRER
jgi:8-oxo-dGTP pyrophosphatase MutT (NUDIX family)